MKFGICQTSTFKVGEVEFPIRGELLVVYTEETESESMGCKIKQQLKSSCYLEITTDSIIYYRTVEAYQYIQKCKLYEEGLDTIYYWVDIYSLARNDIKLKKPYLTIDTAKYIKADQNLFMIELTTPEKHKIQLITYDGRLRPSPILISPMVIYCKSEEDAKEIAKKLKEK